MTIYAIGDIHGQLDKLMTVHMDIALDQQAHGQESARIVHVGDLVDRGPDSKGVIDYLIQRRDAGFLDVCLKGNHDRFMESFLHPDCLTDPLRSDLHWLDANIGGRTTLESYGVDTSRLRRSATIHRDAIARVPQAHVEFISALALSYSAPGVFFCHAGVRPGIPLGQQHENDLLWIRREFLDDTRDHGALVVHGHTPVENVEHAGNRLNLDTGAAYGRALSAVVIEDDLSVHQIVDGARVPVPPQGPLSA